MKKDSLLFGGFACFLLYCLLRYPEAMLTASANSIQLWLTKVFPSLFPFLAACGLLLQMGVAEKIGAFFRPIMKPLFGLSGIAAFPFFLGILSGYPMGAKITALLYEKKLISLEDAQHILVFSNNPGPLFLVGTVGVAFFGVAFWGYALLLCSFLGAVTTGVLWRFGKKKGTLSTITYVPAPREASPFPALSDSIYDAMMTVLQIGGYLILFGTLTECMQQARVFRFFSAILFFLPLSPESLQGLCSGMMEMTNGAYFLSLAPDALSLRLALTAFLVAFGGISILGQTLGVLSAIPISKKGYIKGKLCNALFSSLFFYLLYPFFEKKAQKAVPVFSFLTETAISFSFLPALPLFFFGGAVCYAFCRKG